MESSYQKGAPMHCTHCGEVVDPKDRFCTHCGQANPSYGKYREESSDGRYKTQAYDNYQTPPPYAPTNQGYPQRPGKFNWGAFTFTVAWGIGNNCYLCLLALIPGLNIIMSFIAGFMGNRWAMENNTYRDMEEFSKIQQTWNRAGFIFFIIAVIPLAFFMFIGFMGLITVPSLSNNWV